MSVVVPFQFETCPVRVIDRDGESWFVAGDVAGILGYGAAKDLTRTLEEDEKDGHRVPTPGGEQEVLIINEAGLYRAILQRRATSSVPAEIRQAIVRFQRWVFHEVLPSIRSRGGYAPHADQHREALRMVAECRRTFGKAAAQRLWGELGLPAVSGPPATSQPLPVDEVEAFIRQADRPVTRSELYRRVDGRMDARQLDTVMRDLVDSGRVEEVVERTKGRSKTSYRPRLVS